MCYNEQNKVVTSMQLASNTISKQLRTLTYMFGKRHDMVLFFGNESKGCVNGHDTMVAMFVAWLPLANQPKC